jgi:hypothetical protein
MGDGDGAQNERRAGGGNGWGGGGHYTKMRPAHLGGEGADTRHSARWRAEFCLTWLIVGHLGVLAKCPRGATGAYIRGTTWAECHPGVG